MAIVIDNFLVVINQSINMSTHWAKITQIEPVNVENIISREVAGNLRAKEEKREKFDTAEEIDVVEIQSEVLESVTDDDVANDAILAKLLQMQFDGEYELNRTKRKSRGHSKVSTTSENYLTAPLNYSVESDFQEEEIIGDEMNWDAFELLEKEFACVPTQHILKRDKKVKPKQHVRIDTYKLSSKVFNSLKPHSYTEEFCKYKVYDKKYKLLGVDEYTWRLIRKMIKHQIIKKVISIISLDKEVVTICAIQSWMLPRYKCHRMALIRPKLCLIKVFKVTSTPFEKARIIARQKAQREAAIYARLRVVGVPCLDVTMLRENVLIMSYLGPPLSEEKWTVYTYECIYEKVKKMMKKMFVDAHLVHANLSEHNILWYACEVYFINLSQSVDSSHENAFNFLFRDCTNIIYFFKRRGCSNVKDQNKLFKYITGYSFCDKRSLLKLQKAIRTNMLKIETA